MTVERQFGPQEIRISRHPKPRAIYVVVKYKIWLLNIKELLRLKPGSSGNNALRFRSEASARAAKNKKDLKARALRSLFIHVF